MTQSTSYRNPGFEYTNIENRNRISEMGSQSYPHTGYRISQNHEADYDTNNRYNNGYEEERYNNRPEYVDDYPTNQRLHQHHAYYQDEYRHENWEQRHPADYAREEYKSQYRNSPYQHPGAYRDYEREPREIEYEDEYYRHDADYYSRPINPTERYRVEPRTENAYYGQHQNYNDYYTRPRGYNNDHEYQPHEDEYYERAQGSYYEPRRLNPYAYYYNSRAEYGNEQERNRSREYKGYKAFNPENRQPGFRSPYPSQNNPPYADNRYNDPEYRAANYNRNNRANSQPGKRGYAPYNKEERTRIAKLGGKAPHYAR